MASQIFNPVSDIIKTNVGSNALCSTSFVPFKLKQFINGKNYTEVQVKAETIPGFPVSKIIFCLNFINQAPSHPLYFGDLPCPEQCIPDHPMFLVENSFAIPNSFNKVHFEAILAAAMADASKLIGVAISFRGGGNTENSLTLFIHDITSIDRTPAQPAFITI